jgi:hypothetical protein
LPGVKDALIFMRKGVRKNNRGFDRLKCNIFTGKIPRQNPPEQ